MLDVARNNSPDALGARDAATLRGIVGDLADESARYVLGADDLAVKHRLTTMLKRRAR